MIMDIVIDSDSIIWLFTQIIKYLIFSIILVIIIASLLLSTIRYMEGEKQLAYQYLITFFMLIGSCTLLFYIIYFGLGINLLKVLLEK